MPTDYQGLICEFTGNVSADAVYLMYVYRRRRVRHLADTEVCGGWHESSSALWESDRYHDWSRWLPRWVSAPLVQYPLRMSVSLSVRLSICLSVMVILF